MAPARGEWPTIWRSMLCSSLTSRFALLGGAVALRWLTEVDVSDASREKGTRTWNTVKSMGRAGSGQLSR